MRILIGAFPRSGSVWFAECVLLHKHIRMASEPLHTSPPPDAKWGYDLGREGNAARKEVIDTIWTKEQSKYNEVAAAFRERYPKFNTIREAWAGRRMSILVGAWEPTKIIHLYRNWHSVGSSFLKRNLRWAIAHSKKLLSGISKDIRGLVEHCLAQEDKILWHTFAGWFTCMWEDQKFNDNVLRVNWNMLVEQPEKQWARVWDYLECEQPKIINPGKKPGSWWSYGVEEHDTKGMNREKVMPFLEAIHQPEILKRVAGEVEEFRTRLDIPLNYAKRELKDVPGCDFLWNTG